VQQHIFIVTVGSRGDVQPFVAIGQRLVKEGYRVTLCASSTFESFVRDHGIEYAFLNDSLVDLINSDTARDVLDRKGGIVGTIRFIVKLIQMASPMQRQMLNEIWTAAQTCKPDLILYHPKAYGGAMAAEKLSIPAVLGLLFPQYVPTADFPALGFPRLGIGSWYTLGPYQRILVSGRG